MSRTIRPYPGKHPHLPHIASISGGKDSTIMVDLLLRSGWPLDEIVYFDEGTWAFPEMRAHISLMEQKYGIKVTRLNQEDPVMFERILLTKPRRKTASEPGHGFPKPKYRWCTKIKTRTIDAYIKKKYGKNVINYIGYAYDEFRRIEKRSFQSAIYPLYTFRVVESQALAMCLRRGFHWDGLYNWQHRVSCWCCPLQSLGNLRGLYTHRPELWEVLRQWQGVLDDHGIPEWFRMFKLRGRGRGSIFEIEKQFESRKPRRGFGLC